MPFRYLATKVPKTNATNAAHSRLKIIVFWKIEAGTEVIQFWATHLQLLDRCAATPPKYVFLEKRVSQHRQFMRAFFFCWEE